MMSLNLHFPFFAVGSPTFIFTDSLYQSDIFDKHLVEFLNSSVNSWWVQISVKYGIMCSCTSMFIHLCHTMNDECTMNSPLLTNRLIHTTPVLQGHPENWVFAGDVKDT
jgi:hypothetical protein